MILNALQVVYSIFRGVGGDQMRVKRISTLLICLCIMVVSACSAQNKEKTQIVTTIYSLDLKDYEDTPIDGIPYYSRGEIKHLNEETVNSFHEGHHPWLGHAESFVETQVSNLVPTEYKKDEDINKEFIKIRNLSENGAVATIIISDNFLL